MQANKRKFVREPKKMVSRFDPWQWERAEAIRDKYGFKSIYEMGQALWAGFLRVVDPDNEAELGYISVEMEDIYGEIAKIVLAFKDGKPMGRMPEHVIDRLCRQLSLFPDVIPQSSDVKQSREPPLNETALDSDDVERDEITDMFESLSHAEKHFEYVKPKRAMNNASLNDEKQNIIK